MGLNVFRDQIEERRIHDNEQYQGAYANLASVLDSDIVKRNSDSALSDAVVIVLNAVGVTPPEVPNSMTDPQERITYMLRITNTMRRSVELKGEWWKNCSGALLASDKNGAVVAIVPDKLKGYKYTSPSGEIIRINRKTAGNIKKDAFCFYRSLPMRSLTLNDLIKHMVQCLTFSDVVLALALSLAVGLVGLLTPYINKELFQTVVPSNLKSNILPIASMLVGAAIGTALFGISRNLVMTRMKERIDLSVQSATMGRVFSLPVSFFKDYTAGDMATRIGALNSLCTLLFDTVLATGLTTAFSLVYVFSLISYAPLLVFPALLIILAVLVFSVIQTLVEMKLFRKKYDSETKLSGLTFALLSGIQKIKLAGAEKRAFAQWSKLYSVNAKLLYKPPYIIRLSTAISAFIMLSGTILLYYLAAANNVSVASYMAFNSAYGAFSAAFISLTGIVATLAQVRPILELTAPIMETEPETSDNKEIIRSLSGGIEINGLTFRYRKDSQPIINELSLKIKSGEFVAIVGKTGCGKSTLLRLLLGFEKPERGAIYYDGKDLATLDLPSVRRKIGICLQNGKLFSGDIYSNITITAPEKSADDAWEAAEMAGFAEDIRNMPMGMHTMLSEGGGGISGGQKQRLLIARSLISKPKILFFDEATSALDNITQKRVTESVASLKCTRIVIAHRLSTIQNADRIIMLDKGRIVEEGTYEKLIEKKGKFFELAKQQII